MLTVLAQRHQWRDEVRLVRQLHATVLSAERILAGTSVAEARQAVTNATVQERYDQWCATLRERLPQPDCTHIERNCLNHFLHVTQNMRPRLFQCYDQAAIPRTNNDLEGFIRSVKTRYRRISGRKNWNRYLIRYGAWVVYYEGRARTGEMELLGPGMRRVSGARWRQERAAQQQRKQEQLKQYRVRHRRTAYLAALEERWAALMS